MDSILDNLSAVNLATFKKKINEFNEHVRREIRSELDNRYYNTGERVISDEKYDYIAELCNEHKIGCKLRDMDNAVKLPYNLNSMDKVKQGEDKKLEKFFEKSACRKCIVSDKLNGVSCLICYGSSPGDIKLYTRGDGITGADISYFKNLIKGVISGPTNINVRGELIIPKDDFARYYARDYKNSLAMLVSVVNSKSLKEPIKHVQFVAYEVVTELPEKSPSENLCFLEKCGFNVVYNKTIETPTDEMLGKYLAARYESSEFSIDGLILQVDTPYNRANVSASGNPNYAIAYKMVTDSCETIVEDVLWAPSRYSTLKPRIQIKPVELCGVTIRYVTGSNAKFIKDNKINVGSRVLVIRAGEIIPKIEGVITHSNEGKMPETPYRWNETGVDIISDYNEDDLDITVQRLVFFFSTLGVKQIAEGVVKKLVTHGYSDVFKIMEMTEDDFMKIPTFEKKMSQKLHKSLRDVSTEPIDMSIIMSASGIFGQGLGVKKLKTLITAIPTILTKTPTKVEIEKVNGFSDKTSTKILEGLEKFKDFYDKFSKYLNPQITEQVEETDSIFTEEEIRMTKEVNGISTRLKGQIFAFTNFRDKELEKRIVDAGGEIGESVTKKTTCLVVPDGSSGLVSGKISKARQYGVQIKERSDVCKLV